MKKITLIIFFIFTNILAFNTTSYAEDISEFQIEGFAIGENLSNYFTKQEITKFKKNNLMDKYKKNSGEFTEIRLDDGKDISLETYQTLLLVLNESNIISGIGGVSEIKVSECMKIKDEIKENILKIFWRSKLIGEGWQRTEQWGDVFFVGIEFEDGYASVQCFKSGYLNVMTILEKVI